MYFLITGEDEEWSDSEKTPSVSSGLEGGGGSALSSPTGAGGGSHQLADDDLVTLPPPTRLNATDPGSDVRLRLSAVQLSSPCGNDDVVRKRLAVSLGDDYEVRFFKYYLDISNNCYYYSVTRIYYRKSAAFFTN